MSIPLILVESSSPPFPTITNICARKTPASIPSTLPSMFPGESWSRKNSTMPAIVIMTTRTSLLCSFSLKNSAEIIRIKIGAVYCSTIALAAVVSLFAIVKSVAEKPRPIPASSEYLFSLNFVCVAAMYIAMMLPEIALRMPAIKNGLQEISLMNIPPRLHMTAVMTMSSMALFLRLISVCVCVIYSCRVRPCFAARRNRWYSSIPAYISPITITAKPAYPSRYRFSPVMCAIHSSGVPFGGQFTNM